jgi:hypothetical protein
VSLQDLSAKHTQILEPFRRCNIKLIIGILFVLIGICIVPIKVLQIPGALLVIMGSAFIFKHIRIQKTGRK